MGLVRKKGSKVWHLDITKPDGSRHRASTKTENKQLATQLHDKLKQQFWEEAKLGRKPPVLFKVGVEKLLHEKKDKDVCAEYERQLGWWQAEFDKKYPKGICLHEITKELIVEVIEVKEKTVSRPTCNRYLAALKVCLNLAKEKHGYIDSVPPFFMNEESKGRTRYLKKEEITRLLEELPTHLRAPTVVALSTGLRRSRCIGMRWEQVDLDRKVVHIDGNEMKNGDDLAIPLSEMAVAAIKAQLGKHDTFVFTYAGRGFKRPGKATWEGALERAGITDFKWHDLRHTWATMLTQAGVPDAVLMVLGGWKSLAMVRRYAHHATESVRPHAQVADLALAGVTSSFSHSPGFGGNVVELRKAA